MEEKRRRKKTTIFRMFLFPLIAIMLVQSIITIGTLVVRKTAKTLEEYSSGLAVRLVENRRVILQNDMNQRWAAVCEQEALLNDVLRQLLLEQGAQLEELLGSDKQREQLLKRFFPNCLDLLQNNSTTGIFIILTGENMRSAADFDGFFIRDSDPDTSPVNYTDLLLERGGKHLSREWNIPLDTHWTTRFHMDGQGQNPSDDYFYEPWQAGIDYADADIDHLGYWSVPFSLEKQTEDSHEMITYSVPLRYDGKVYGVLGVEISSKKLSEYFPAEELNDSQQSGYMLAVQQSDGSYTPLLGKGVLYNLTHSKGGQIFLQDADGENFSLVQDVRLDRQKIYAVVCPLKLYGNNVPYENTQWALLGLKTEDDLFGMSRQLYIWMVVAILIGLTFGVFGIYFLVRYITRPVQQLMRCISEGSAGLQAFETSNILEIDALYDVVNDLTQQQKQAENILLEEKERYKVALESSKDIFFSYDIQNQMLDLVNHKTMDGQWKSPKSASGLINPEYIYEADREAAVTAMQETSDNPYVEFRMRWPGEEQFRWVALSGRAIYDTDGRRWKLVGSIRDIHQQKEKEAQQRRKNSTDGVTGLPVFSAGMRQLLKCRSARPEGVMVHLFLGWLKETNEKNGIVFSDMILEEIGELIRTSSRTFAADTGRQLLAFRLDGDEFVFWLEGQSRQQAEKWIGKLLDQIAASFAGDLFNVWARAGLVLAGQDQSDEKLICMAEVAQQAASSAQRYAFYEDLPAEKRGSLPMLQGREINSLDYSEDVGLVSLALNLFGKGDNFPAQMTLMIRKIGRFYRADQVMVSVLRADFHSNYLEYQWSWEKKEAAESVRPYKEEDKERFCQWLGQEEVRYFSSEDSAGELLPCFLGVSPGQYGAVLPMYDSGSYMGNLCIVGMPRQLLENAEEHQILAELGRVIQGQLNQQQHDIASKAKSDFLSRMSHEIRTPMNGIIGMTAIALQQNQSQERMTDCLLKIQSSSSYLLGLINDILDMSKIESGKMKLEPVNFSIYEMLDTIQELIEPQAAAKKIHFSRDVDLTHSWFVADQMRISQVLINLLGNAVKFTPENGQVTLRVREREAGGETVVSFAVQDTGIGISEEDQGRVFRSFEQAGGINPSKQQGTGLGLSISSRLVQLMGSSIQLESALGKGSTFSFAIPLQLGENLEAETEEEELSFDGCRILVVEDNELNAEIAQTILEDRGFLVECVYDGSQAVERIRSTPPHTYDVILMDIMMPVMDGLEATRTIRRMEREDCRTIPIVAMSANAFDDDLKKSVECGMNGHLSKPVEVDKLYQKLNEVIHRDKK